MDEIEQPEVPQEKPKRINPRYWYKTPDGTIKKYVYCCLCLSGPFKQEDSTSYTYLGHKNPYCTKCVSTLRLGKEEHPQPKVPQNTENDTTYKFHKP